MLALKRISVSFLIIFVFLTTGCQQPPQVVKIGLVAPFEGRYREIGYEIIPAIRLAVREWSETPEGRDIIIEIVAYDDMGDPALAIKQAKKLAADPEVVLVIGHWLDETTAAALPIYEEAGLPIITFSPSTWKHTPGTTNLSPSADQITALTGIEEFYIEASTHQYNQLNQDLHPDLHFAIGAGMPADITDIHWTEERLTDFAEKLQEGDFGVSPGLFSITAYEAGWLGIKSIAETYGLNILTPIDHIQFDSQGRRIAALIYIYQWQGDNRIVVDILD